MKKTIKSNSISEQTIEKSKFITYMYSVKNEDDVNSYLSEIRKIHHKASHNCYAFIIDDHLKRSSDDGEPSGTAGRPILSVLESNNISETLCIVTRYFGGKKLGTGGLVRAYGSSATLGLETSGICEWLEGYLYELVFPYGFIDQMEYFLKIEEVKILNKEYYEAVTFQIETTGIDFEKRIKQKFPRDLDVTFIEKKLIQSI